MMQKQDRAFRESKVRVMKLYSRIVDGDRLPSPFNLVQLLLRVTLFLLDKFFHLRARAIMREFGVGIFWFMLGPLAILAAWALWTASVPTALLKVWREADFTKASLARAVFYSVGVVVLHVALVPFIMAFFWVQSGLRLFLSAVKELWQSIKELVRSIKGLVSSLCSSGNRNSDPICSRSNGCRVAPAIGATANDIPAPASVDAAGACAGTNVGAGVVTGVSAAAAAPAAPSVSNMLKQHPGRESSVAEIWAFLEDPLTTPGLTQRQDERAQTSTREDVIRLQQHLDAAGQETLETILAALGGFDSRLTVVELRQQRG